MDKTFKELMYLATKKIEFTYDNFLSKPTRRVIVENLNKKNMIE